MSLQVSDIEGLIPHRSPFLFLQQASLVQEQERIAGIAAWPGCHPILHGHFPQQPIVPGVCQIEACAQLAGVMYALWAKDRPADEIGVLAGVRQAQFKHPVLPDMRLHLLVEVKSRIGSMSILRGKGWLPDLPGEPVCLDCEFTVGSVPLSYLQSLSQ